MGCDIMVTMFNRIIRKLEAGVLFCIKWRYLIALIVFVLCVALNLHGSSIGLYDEMFLDDNDAGRSVLIGKSHAIRSDEWLVHTPYYMSQEYNDFGRESHMMSLGGQDMIIGYNAPVADITMIAKPFTWGYFLLGNEYGLSWYWCSKLILLILVSFELCMIVTRKNKKVSLLGTLMLVFAPTVQWWFVPHMVDVFFWGMAVFVLAYHFFMAKKWWRLLFAVLLCLSMITFVLALFPSLQLPVGLLMLVLFVVAMIRDKEDIAFRKSDAWQIVLMAVFVLGVLGYTIWMSKDALSALNDTVYPGHRVSLGGNYSVKDLFTDLTSFVLPFKDITYSNNCEVSTFIHFAPVFLLLYPVIRKKMKNDKNLLIGNALIVCIIVMVVFMIVGFPLLLAKLTGFSYINRMKIVYGLAATILSVWGIDMVWRRKLFTKKQVFEVLAIYGFLNVCFIGSNELSYLRFRYYLIMILGLLLLIYLMLMRHKKLFFVGMSAVMVLAGATVNPIARGVEPLFSHSLEKKINEISSTSPEDYWLAIGDTRLAAIGVANGARMLNMVNFYPDFSKWNLIDPEQEYKDIYNRYAHIAVYMTNEDTEFEPGESPDIFKLQLNYKDSLKWPIKYLLVSGKLDKSNRYYKQIYCDEGELHCVYERIVDEKKNN